VKLRRRRRAVRTFSAAAVRRDGDLLSSYASCSLSSLVPHSLSRCCCHEDYGGHHIRRSKLVKGRTLIGKPVSSSTCLSQFFMGGPLDASRPEAFSFMPLPKSQELEQQRILGVQILGYPQDQGNDLEMVPLSDHSSLRYEPLRLFAWFCTRVTLTYIISSRHSVIIWLFRLWSLQLMMLAALLCLVPLSDQLTWLTTCLLHGLSWLHCTNSDIKVH